MKVIVYDLISRADPILRIGETDGKRIDRDYVRVDGELYHSAYVCEWTAESEERIRQAATRIRVLKNQIDLIPHEILRIVGHL